MSQYLSGWNLDTPLLTLSDKDPFTIRDACEGVQVFGGIGSGKTSGSGAALARAYLLAGFGGLVCCAKPEERALWQRYAAETGRTKDLVIVRPGEGGQPPRWCFNFLDYELSRASAGGGHTENVVNLLYAVVELVRGKQAQDSENDFWTLAGRELINNAVDLLALADMPLTLDAVCKIIISAPQEAPQSKAWQEGDGLCATCIRACEVKETYTETQLRTLGLTATYWLQSFATLTGRTRSGITATVSSVINVLLRGLAWELLCNDPALTNIIPEVTYLRGAVIVLDLSVQDYREAGRIVQGVWKRLFQEALLRRRVEEHSRPVFLWCDESQNFVSPFDYEFQSTARSARVCTVYLTQNISNYHARLGVHAKAQADSLLGLFGTKIFHAQADTLTNQYAADLFGKELTDRNSQGAGSTGAGGGSFNVGTSESLEYMVQPSEFGHLLKGGPQNGGVVTAYVTQAGKTWWNEGGRKRTGGTYLLAYFTQ